MYIFICICIYIYIYMYLLPLLSLEGTKWVPRNGGGK